jgi:SAM-dependent methyltransferase
MDAASHTVQKIREHYHEVACGAWQGSSVARGCGKPLSRAELKRGELVIDLGCGGGAEVIEAARLVGESGHVYGLDMTTEMLRVARAAADEAQIRNVSFIEGYLEDIPLDDGSADVIISNCVINLCDDKALALKEAFRVLRPKGRMAIADIIALKDIDADMRDKAADLLGCTNGVLFIDDYERLLREAGFSLATVEPYETYGFASIRFKALTRDRKDELAALDEKLTDNLLASAYILAEK